MLGGKESALFTGQHTEALHVIEDLKKEILCEGDMCRPVLVVPEEFYKSYVDIMKIYYEDTSSRVLKQRQFSSLCNKLFDSRADFILHKSTYKNNKFFYHDDRATCTLDLSTIPDNVLGYQKNAFFLIRDCARYAHENNQTLTLKIRVDNMSTMRLVAFYFNSSGRTHINGYLMHSCIEVPLKMVIVTSNRLQKMAAKFLCNAISEKPSEIEFP